jgi:hypothetical protein
MARQYLRVGSQEISVTDEQVKELTKHRWDPEKVREIRMAIIAASNGPRTGPTTANPVAK